MTNCTLVFVREQDGKYVHQCQLCRTEYRSKYADPSMFKAQCRVKAREQPPEPPRPVSGPGRELEKLIKELGLASFGCGSCKELAKQMDLWGPNVCRERRAEIVSDIRGRAKQVGWWSKSKAALAAVREDWWNPLDNIGSMVDESIRRATTLQNSDS